MFDLRFETFQFLIRDERTRTGKERTLVFVRVRPNMNERELGKILTRTQTLVYFHPCS